MRHAVWTAGARLLSPQILTRPEPDEQLFANPSTNCAKITDHSFDTVSDAIAAILGTVTPTECANYLINAGFDRD